MGVLIVPQRLPARHFCAKYVNDVCELCVDYVFCFVWSLVGHCVQTGAASVDPNSVGHREFTCLRFVVLFANCAVLLAKHVAVHISAFCASSQGRPCESLAGLAWRSGSQAESSLRVDLRERVTGNHPQSR